MNKRRKRALEELLERLSTIINEEQEAIDNMPDGLRESDAVMQREDALECLREAEEAIQSAINT